MLKTDKVGKKPLKGVCVAEGIADLGRVVGRACLPESGSFWGKSIPG